MALKNKNWCQIGVKTGKSDVFKKYKTVKPLILKDLQNTKKISTHLLTVLTICAIKYITNETSTANDTDTTTNTVNINPRRNDLC